MRRREFPCGYIDGLLVLPTVCRKEGWKEAGVLLNNERGLSIANERGLSIATSLSCSRRRRRRIDGSLAHALEGRRCGLYVSLNKRPIMHSIARSIAHDDGADYNVAGWPRTSLMGGSGVGDSLEEGAWVT